MDGRRGSALVFAPAARDPHRAASLSLVPPSRASALHDGRIGSMGEAKVLHDTLERHDIEAGS
jgi:hypothetical protein